MNSEVNRCKFADTCLLDMKKELIGKGADPSRLAAKIAGGARMFSFISDNSMLNIGDQNIEAVSGGLVSGTSQFWPVMWGKTTADQFILTAAVKCSESGQWEWENTAFKY